jgi:site-specific DNA-methyltransferase (adenine-specific)
MKYKIIYADPPWTYQGNMMNSSVTDHYNVMTINQLKEIPVRTLADNDCVLFLWVTMPKLNEVFDVIKSWGFEYKTVAFTWVKENKRDCSYFVGLGRWTRANVELCLLATKGKPKRIDKGVRQLVVSKIREHSRKPDEVRNRIIRLLGDLPRIELFARNRVDGWDCYGNQLSKTIQKLL